MERYGCHYMDVVDGQFSESERDSMSNGELWLRAIFITYHRPRSWRVLRIPRGTLS